MGRKAIFEVHLKGLNLGGKSTEFSGRLAGLTPGFVGADIENLCNEAAIVAARRDKKKIEMVDFEVRYGREREGDYASICGSRGGGGGYYY